MVFAISSVTPVPPSGWAPVVKDILNNPDGGGILALGGRSIEGHHVKTRLSGVSRRREQEQLWDAHLPCGMRVR
jgi:hypothetical protein